MALSTGASSAESLKQIADTPIDVNDRFIPLRNDVANLEQLMNDSSIYSDSNLNESLIKQK